MARVYPQRGILLAGDLFLTIANKSNREGGLHFLADFDKLL